MNVRVGSLLVQCSRYTFRSAAGDLSVRRQFFHKVVDEAVGAGVRALVLPAGFFRTNSKGDAEALANELCSIIRDREIIVAFGVDEGEAGKEDDKGADHADGDYPFFGFVIEGGKLLIDGARQTGVRSYEVTDTTAEDAIGARIRSSSILGGAEVALLLCGEVQSPAWWSALAARSPSLILHPAHASVQLDGRARESWRDKITGLLSGIPSTTVWVFADHIAAAQHLDSYGQFVPLARQGGGEQKATLGRSFSVAFQNESGWLYTYDVMVSVAANRQKDY